MAYKYYNTKRFEVGNYSIVCQTQNTSYGFRHVAEAKPLDGWETIATAKACYYNRTWESFEYQSVLKAIIDKLDIPETEAILYLKQLENAELEKVNDGFRLVASVARLGEVLADTQAEKNKWKARMLKAGLPLDFPSDWESLSEEEKETRLNKVIAQLK